MVSFGLTPDISWENDPADVIEATRRAGYSSVGVSFDWAGVDAARLAAAGLGCHELMGVQVTEDAGALDADAAVLVERVDALRAPWVIGIVTAPLTDDVRKSIRRFADVIGEAGARFGLEFSVLGTVATIGDAREVVRAAGIERVGVVLDSYQFFVGASTWDDLAALPLEEIAYVQFADGRAPTSGDMRAEATGRRLYPGDGEFDLERFAASMLGRGWDGVVSTQVWNQELYADGLDEWARRCFESTVRYWH